MSRNVTVKNLDPEDVRRLKAFSKGKNETQAARLVFKAGLNALEPPKPAKKAAKKKAPKKAASLGSGSVDMTADATPFALD